MLPVRVISRFIVPRMLTTYEVRWFSSGIFLYILNLGLSTVAYCHPQKYQKKDKMYIFTRLDAIT